MANATSKRAAESEKPVVNMTVGLNRSSYERLKELGANTDQSLHEVVGSSLRLYEALTQEDEQAEYFIRRPGSDEIVPLEIFQK